MLFSTMTLAQEKVPPRVVRVVGTAEVKVVPDRVVINVAIQKMSPVASTAKEAVDSASKRVIAVMRQSGLGEKDIQTTYLTLQPQYDFKNGRKFSHFSAQQGFTVTLRDISKLDAVLDAVIGAGANEINSIQYETSELRRYRDQARAEAVKAAKEKADDLAKTLGQQIGKAYTIEEVPDYNYQWLVSRLTRTPSQRATMILKETRPRLRARRLFALP